MENEPAELGDISIFGYRYNFFVTPPEFGTPPLQWGQRRSNNHNAPRLKSADLLVIPFWTVLVEF